MYKTNKNRLNKWEIIERNYKTSFQRIETSNGFAFDQNSSTKPMYTNGESVYTITGNESHLHPSNIYFNIKNKSDYYYSQPPVLPQSLALSKSLFIKK